MSGLDQRRTSAVVGGITLVLLVASVQLLIGWRSGRFDADYELVATFDGVGQFFRPGADVNVRGVTVGEVTAIDLRDDNRAEVRLAIGAEHRIPADATATVRSKSLLGPKFLDLEFDPADGDDVLGDGDRIAATADAAELEPVLTNLHDLLAAVDPLELGTVVGTLSEASRGQGETFGRVIDDGAAVLDVVEQHRPAVAAGLQSLAAVSEELGAHAGDLRSLTTDLNRLLPTVTARDRELAALLDATAGLSSDVGALMADNVATFDVLIGNGGRILGVVDARIGQVAPSIYAVVKLLVGLDEVVSLPVPGGGIAYRDQAVFPPTICELFVHQAPGGGTQLGPYTGNGFCAATPDGGPDGEVVGGPNPVPSTEDLLGPLPDLVTPVAPPAPEEDPLEEILGLMGARR